MTFTLLIADDAREIARAVAYGARMTWPGCAVALAASGDEALRLFAQTQPDLVVLDVSMPPPDGLEVLRRIRETSAVPILMLTVREATLDKVRALDLGADDYVTKPFDHIELLARLRALVRRSHAQQVPVLPVPVVAIGDLVIDVAARRVRVHGEEVHLTPTEYRLLAELVRQAGAVVPHQALIAQVWGPDFSADAQHLKVFVRRLRQKLGDDAERPRYIQTVWGMGYRFTPPD